MVLSCCANTLEELATNWERVLSLLQKGDIRLSVHKTVICPLQTTILGWIWRKGTLSASPHRIATLEQCSQPESVHGLRSFIGAYKMLARVLPNCSEVLSDLDSLVAGKPSQARIQWSEELTATFQMNE